MKITKRQLKKIIREEYIRVLNEGSRGQIIGDSRRFAEILIQQLNDFTSGMVEKYPDIPEDEAKSLIYNHVQGELRDNLRSFQDEYDNSRFVSESRRSKKKVLKEAWGGWTVERRKNNNTVSASTIRMIDSIKKQFYRKYPEAEGSVMFSRKDGRVSVTNQNGYTNSLNVLSGYGKSMDYDRMSRWLENAYLGKIR